METKYTLEYFINFFESIPEEEWGVCEFQYQNKKCAFGHCGAKHGFDDTEESMALDKLDDFLYAKTKTYITQVNDGHYGDTYKYGTTPKERVVNYLKSLRDETLTNR